jgi:hypothetical protein
LKLAGFVPAFSMSHVLRIFLQCFPLFTVTPGGSMRHTRNMEKKKILRPCFPQKPQWAVKPRLRFATTAINFDSSALPRENGALNQPRRNVGETN